MESWGRKRLGITLLLALILGFTIGVGTYTIGKSSGENLDAARAEGELVGNHAGAEQGRRAGRLLGMKHGKDEGFKSTYGEAYREAYRAAFEEAGLSEPETVEVSAP